ncbi:hypothetical protein AB2L28_06625 [Kineococcus sp. TBRC 1896]|uniref:DUF4190 domain-containing protein n=1 Tax=Kineococcus mangrovi TaxID=1660183 RepID=A0ABV4I088_9ACTN
MQQPGTPRGTQPTDQPAQPTNTGAVAGIVASVAGLVVSLVIAPLSIVMGLVVVGFGVRALRTGHPDRGWWTAALALAVVCVVVGVAATAVVLA